ncbi:MAG: tetratricopeptide repeat protein [Candidatus Flexifilum sp.]
MSVPHPRRLAATLWLLPGAFLALEAALILLLLIAVSGAVDLQSAAVSHSEWVHPYREDRPVQAAAVLEANAARLGWEGVDLRAAGDAWFRAGDRRAALAFWQAAAAAGVDDPRLYRQLAAVYLESRRWDEADRALSLLIDAPSGTSGDRAWAYFQRGLVRLADDPALARLDLRAALQLESGYAASLERLLQLLDLQISEAFRLASALSAAGLFDHAAAVMEHAVSRGDLGNDEARGLAYAAVLLAQAGRPADAYVQRALALRPDDHGVLFLSGLYWRLRGEYEASVQAFQAAAALDPSDPIVFAELGYSYEALGDLEMARFWLSRAAAFADDGGIYAEDADRLAHSIDSVLASMGFVMTPTAASSTGDAPDLTETPIADRTQQAEPDAEATLPADPIR